ncbi:P-loop NTPase [Nodosilinea sp. LEGE 06152]|nr:P-loop NTPase [Nodosilinea sp. LEGE 06152]
MRTTLAIASGKGGGKLTTVVQLAIALTRTGASVGLLSADIYGPNVPQRLGLEQAQAEVVETQNGQRFVPLKAHGIFNYLLSSKSIGSLKSRARFNSRQKIN